MYRAIEATIGRSATWRIGRFLYWGARRELVNDPANNGEYTLIRRLLECLDRFSSREQTVTLFDVGANIGDWTGAAIAALRSHGLADRSRIYAFEPAPKQRLQLTERFKERVSAKALFVHASAVGAAPGEVAFEVTGDTTGTSAIAAAAAGSDLDDTAVKRIAVEVQTIDQIAHREGIGEILILKIDTEGNDFNVISGARRMLDERRIAVVQFEYNWRWIPFGYCLKTVFDFLGRRDYAFGTLTRDGVEIHAKWHPELDRFIETNYVLVRRDVLPWLPHRQMAFTAANTIRPA